MRLDVLTLFPGILEGFFTSSIMARAVERGLVDYHHQNPKEKCL